MNSNAIFGDYEAVAQRRLARGRALLDESADPRSEPREYLQGFSVRYEYPVIFTRDLFAPANDVLVRTMARREPERRHKLLCFIDGGVAENWPELSEAIVEFASHHTGEMTLAATPQVVMGGEDCKNDPALLQELQRMIVAAGLDRQSFVLAIGGGALLDLVGFAAATVHRGVRLIRAPTTVLSQNDSGVGVKNGVNAFECKNMIGAFAPPFAVINDSRFLTRLDMRDKIAGAAEAVKVALIRDGDFFRWLEARADALRAGDMDEFGILINRCAELHMRQIALGGDPFERGSARPLDFGHWSAHKLEMLTHHTVRHGEAVAIGIALDARYSVLSGLLEDGEDDRICSLLTRIGLPTWHSALETKTPSGGYALLAGLNEFREHLGGELTVTLLSSVGCGVEVHAMNEGQILASIEWLRRQAAL